MAVQIKTRSRRKGGQAPLVALLVVGTLMTSGYLYSRLSAARYHAPVGNLAALMDHTGRSFAAESRGRDYKLVVFGYTHCPDVCPVTLLRVHEVLKAMGSNDQHVLPLFVTVDPGHDTVNALASYTAAFDPRILGITGTPPDVRAFAAAYGVLSSDPAIARRDAVRGHSAMIYLLGPDNSMLDIYGPDEAVTTIAADVLQRTQQERT